MEALAFRKRHPFLVWIAAIMNCGTIASKRIHSQEYKVAFRREATDFKWRWKCVCGQITFAGPSRPCQDARS